MFMIETNPAEGSKQLLRRIEKFLGHVPPHFELFATLNPKRFEMFIQEIFYLAMHKQINPDFFACMRLFISAREGFTYCYHFNTRLLLQKGYTQDDLDALEASSDHLPMDEKHQVLFATALKAIDRPDAFGTEDLEAAKKTGWSDADVFDAIDHGAFLYRFSKILKAYAR